MQHKPTNDLLEENYAWPDDWTDEQKKFVIDQALVPLEVAILSVAMTVEAGRSNIKKAFRLGIYAGILIGVAMSPLLAAVMMSLIGSAPIWGIVPMMMLGLAVYGLIDLTLYETRKLLKTRKKKKNERQDTI